jgi:SAM-dependent methyltransferase
MSHKMRALLSRARFQIEVTIVPTRRAASGWLLRLRVLNRGTPATLAADVTRIVGTLHPPTNLPLSLGWRRSETSPRRALGRGEREMVRLAYLQPSPHSARMIVLSADADDRAEYALQPGRTVVICVALRNAENGRTLATKNVAISLNEELDEAPAVGFFGGGAESGSFRDGGPRFAAAGDWRASPTAIVPVGRDVSKVLPDPTDDDDPTASGPPVEPPRANAAVLEARTLSERDERFFGDVLRCSNCKSAYDIDSREIVCTGCGIRFPVVDGIPVLNKDTTIVTMLEEVDYDGLGQVNDNLVRNVGKDWTNIITELGVRTDHVLEIGSGTGVLTRGLLEVGSVGHVTATDVSGKFLRELARLTDTYDTPVSLVVCDANEANFRTEAFDLVLGRSILHHLLHYDETLRQCNAMLKPGGAAVFFEPILQGKIFLTLLLAIVLRCDELSGDPQLSPTDVGRVRRVLGFHMKAKLYPQDFESLARLEDKYVFDIDELRRVGTDVGFSRVDYINNGSIDPSFWPRLVFTLRGIDVDPRKIDRYRWIGQEFDNTYGLMFGDRIATPMAYFVFHK